MAVTVALLCNNFVSEIAFFVCLGCKASLGWKGSEGVKDGEDRHEARRERFPKQRKSKRKMHKTFDSTGNKKN